MATCEGCGKPDPKQQCPKCREFGLIPSLFCTQDCFKANWKTHKEKHSQPPVPCLPTMSPIELATFNFTGPLRPGLITPRRFVPATIARPDYADHPQGASASEEADKGMNIPRWAGPQLDGIKRVCALTREVADIAVAASRVGVTTDEIDRIVHEATVERGMYPSTLNYYNFPKSLCTSLNEIICHGIPDSRELCEGDILNVDLSAYLGGFHADMNETIFIGKPDDESARLVHCAYECMQAGIERCAPNKLYKHIGDAIEAKADVYGCSVVRKYCGHGVGRLFHTSPNIPHYGNNRASGTMLPGHVFTVEPMINLGSWKDVTWPDNWTSSTVDGKRSAQFEHTLLITPTGVERLTDWKDGIPHYQKQLSAWGIDLPKPMAAAGTPTPAEPAAAAAASS